MITNYLDIQTAERHYVDCVKWTGNDWGDLKHLTVHEEPMSFEDKRDLLALQELAAKKDKKPFHLKLGEELAEKLYHKDMHLFQIPENMRIKF